jgi:hypothetical protein
MYISGYITQADFYRQANRVDGQKARGASPCLQGETLYRVLVSDLKPPQDLFVRAANWERMKRK